MVKKNKIFFYFMVGVASAVNLYSLFIESIRVDESQAIWVATKSIPVIIQNSLQNLWGPIYPIMLHFWLQIFGTNIFVVRLLSFIFFLAALPFLYRLAKQVGNEDIAILTIIFFSLSPFIIWYSSQAWTYSLFTFSVSINHLFFLKIINSESGEGKLGYLLSSIFGLLTHPFFLFLIISQVLFFIVSVIAKRSTGKAFIKYLFILILSSAPIIYWLKLEIDLGFLNILNGFAALQPTSSSLIQVFVNFLFGFPASNTQIFIISLWPLLTMIILFIFTTRRTVELKDANYLLTVTFLPIFLVFGFSFFRPVFLSRNMIFAAPTLFLLLSWLILTYTKKLYSSLVLVLFLGMFLLAVVQVLSPTVTVREDYSNISNFLARQVTPHDVVLVVPPFSLYPLEYYQQKLIKIDTVPSWNSFSQAVIPVYREKDLAGQIQKYKQVYDRLYVIISNNQGYELKVKNYLDKHLERLEEKEYHFNIIVDVYRLRYDTNLP